MAHDTVQGSGVVKPIPAGVALPAHVPPELAFEYVGALAPNTLIDPYAPAREVFETCPPVFFAPSRSTAASGAGSWVCTRYEDIREVFQNTERYTSMGIINFHKLVGETFTTLPVSVDPPEHDKYRLLMNPWFSPRQITALEPNIYKVVNDLIDSFGDKGECDIAFDFARIYPVKVFMGLMGFPDERFEDFLAWGYAILHGMDDLQKVRWGARSALDYLRGRIAEVRANPGDDVTSRVVHGKVEGRPLTDDEIIGIVFFVWIAGLDTVAATTTLMFRRLAFDPALQQRLRKNPDLLPDAVEEFLRTNPVVNSARIAKVDHELHGVQIRKGDMLTCFVAGGNFDPAEFDEPLSFQTDRASNRHLTFVAGPHRCLGSHLARRELRIALAEFLRRVPPFRLKPGADPTVVPELLAMRNLPLVWDTNG